MGTMSRRTLVVYNTSSLSLYSASRCRHHLPGSAISSAVRTGAVGVVLVDGMGQRILLILTQFQRHLSRVEEDTLRHVEECESDVVISAVNRLCQQVAPHIQTLVWRLERATTNIGNN